MRRKKQPTADMLRQQLALAADEQIRLKSALERERKESRMLCDRLESYICAPWWRRLLGVFS